MSDTEGHFEKDILMAVFLFCVDSQRFAGNVLITTRPNDLPGTIAA